MDMFQDHSPNTDRIRQEFRSMPRDTVYGNVYRERISRAACCASATWVW